MLLHDNTSVFFLFFIVSSHFRAKTIQIKNKYLSFRVKVKIIEGNILSRLNNGELENTANYYWKRFPFCSLLLQIYYVLQPQSKPDIKIVMISKKNSTRILSSKKLLLILHRKSTSNVECLNSLCNGVE